MRLQQSSRIKERGSFLAITMLTIGLLGFILAGYLTLSSAQNRSIERSQAWNAVMPLIEAGVEEALAHLNQNGLTNIFSDGWEQFLDMAVMERKTGSGRYVVTITVSSRPVIECTAYIKAPAVLSYANLSFPASLGWGQLMRKSGELYRSVRVTTGGGALFAMGMVSKGSIDFNGNNVSSDSFDSADPNFNTNGRYDPAKRKAGGDVATNSGEPGLFNAGNANIMGKVFTGPGGSVIIGANGTVGDLAWVTGGNKGIQPGWFADDMNMSFPSIKVPFTGGYTPGPGAISETNFTYGTSMVTVTELPMPLPPNVQTNYGTITSTTYPDPVPYGGVITNYVRVTSTEYPTNAFGPVTTNSMTVTTNVLPNPLPPGPIITNTVVVTNVTLPNPPPSGTIVTNVVAASVRYPYSPMPPGPPSEPPTWTPPEPGTYVGPVTNRYQSTGANANRGWWHNYAAIASYRYTDKTYTYTIPVSYTYTNITYTYYVPQSYTFPTRTSTNITVTTVNYDYVLDSYNYVLETLSGTVYVRGDATLYVRTGIQLTGQGCIVIGPKGSLRLYMGGAEAKIAGRGAINKTGLAYKFIYYGLDSNTSLDISGNGEFVGCIYAPNADLFLRGGGNNTEDFIGASVTRSVKMYGHFNFHYDEDLSRRGPRSRYTVTSWNEIGPDETRLLTFLKPFYNWFN